MSTFSQRRSGARNGARMADRAIHEELQRQADAEAVRQDELKAARKAARDAEAARVRLSAEDVRGSRFVRDSVGWHRVVRVSTKSVTVETSYSWTDRIALDKVLEVRA